MPLQIGQVLLERYQIDQLLGEGTFGFVYQATDFFSNTFVAIKELRPDLLYDSDAFRRFTREAEAVREIQHPNIVTGYGLERTENGYYIIMEYMDAGNLGDLLHERGSLTPEESVSVTLRILDALTTIHQHGIIHRDIKPTNILFSQDGCIKLGDFGTAHIPVRGEQSLTIAGTVIGTINHMSPEQARGLRVDARSDIYEMGALLYEMLAGRPYQNFGKNLVHNVDLIERATPLPLPSTVPHSLAVVVDRALSKSPQARFRSAAEMRAALERSYNQWGQPENLTPASPSLRMPLVLLLVAAAGAGLLCSLGAILLILHWVTR